jgi:hypothetical protein
VGYTTKGQFPLANRYYTSQFSHSFERMLVTLIGNVTRNGAASAITAVGLSGAAIARTGTGLYTITLQDKYTALLNCSITMKSALASDIQAQIVSADTTAAIPTIVIRTVVAGVATDIPDLDGMTIRIDLRNSSS